MGPEHEFSVVDENLRVLPIVDTVIKDFSGRIVNFVEQPHFTFGKELQLHVMEVKANEPFHSPQLFEEVMQNAVTRLRVFLEKRYNAHLLGTGMHPLLKLEDTGVWSHRHRRIYEEYDKIFNLKQHGWLNIQSFHLNFPYSNEAEGVQLHNLLANFCAYLPAISASSPLFEGAFSSFVDNRLFFYKENQREIPSIVGDVVPEFISSLSQYRRDIIGRYSRDLVNAGAGGALLFREWVNSRGVIFRFDRKALEIRIMDEQECIKSDVALSCFIRAAIRALMAEKSEPISHELLVNDFTNVIAEGLQAKVHHPEGNTAREVCQYYFKLASKNAEGFEKDYLWLVKERIERGNLSDLIRKRISIRAQRTDILDAIRSVYSNLINCLANNQPYL